MTNIDPAHEATREAHRQPGGEFGKQEHTAPEATLHEAPPLTDQIAKYLDEYDEEQKAYEEDGDSSGPEADGAYERWEDFRTDNAGNTYELLKTSKARIEELERQLAQEQMKNAIPEELAKVIEDDFEIASTEQPGLYVPQHGADNGDGFIDVIAVVDGETTRKYTMTPEGEISWYRA